MQTWYRDSHGLFDYEEDGFDKLTASEFRVSGSFNVKRCPKDMLLVEKFNNFNLMRLEQKYLEDVREEKIISTNYFLNKVINDKKEIELQRLRQELVNLKNLQFEGDDNG